MPEILFSNHILYIAKSAFVQKFVPIKEISTKNTVDIEIKYKRIKGCVSMKKIYYVTANPQKVKEVKQIFELHGMDYEVIQFEKEILEVQSLDKKDVLRDKIKQAYRELQRPLITDITSIYLEKLRELPGSLSSVFFEVMGNEVIIEYFKGTRAKVSTSLAYCDGKNIYYFFSNEIHGEIVEKKTRGKGFGWDQIFRPDGYDDTFADLDEKEKNTISMRADAVKQLIQHLKKKPLPESSGDEYKKNISKIVDKIVEKRLVLFLGAGVSAAAAGLPSWRKLVEEMGQELTYDEEVFLNSDDYLMLAEFFKLNKGINVFTELMKRKWKVDDEILKNNQIYSNIRRLNLPVIYTTNFDNCFERSQNLDDIYPRYETVFDLDSFITRDDKLGRYMKFHGDIDHDNTIVLSEEQYYERMDFNSFMDICLQSDIMGRSVLFLGYSLSDINIKLLLYRIRRTMKDQKVPESYIFVDKPDDIRSRVLAQTKGIRTVLSPMTNRKESLNKFLQDLVEELEKRKNE